MLKQVLHFSLVIAIFELMLEDILLSLWKVLKQALYFSLVIAIFAIYCVYNGRSLRWGSVRVVAIGIALLCNTLNGNVFYWIEW